MSGSKGAISGSSMLGMGISAAATEAKNCWVGADKCCETFRLFNLNRGRGGEGSRVSSSVNGSGVLGTSYSAERCPSEGVIARILSQVALECQRAKQALKMWRTVSRSDISAIQAMVRIDQILGRKFFFTSDRATINQ